MLFDGTLVLMCEKCEKDAGPNIKLSSEVLSGKIQLRPRKGDVSCMHTRCCKEHWEVAGFSDGTAHLVCPRCGQPEEDIKVELVGLAGKSCECCGEEVQ